MHHVADWQDTSISPPAALASTFALSVHFAPFQLTPPPFQSVPRQNPLAGQDSELMPPPAASMARGALQDAQLKVYTLPSQSPAAQNILDAQETDWSEDPVLSTWAGDQDVPLYVSASPPPLTATQNVLDGQDTEVRPVSVIGFGTVQDWPFQRIARPRVSTATQNAGLAQDTLLSSTLSPPGSMEAGADQEVPFHRRALLPD